MAPEDILIRNSFHMLSEVCRTQPILHLRPGARRKSCPPGPPCRLAALAPFPRPPVSASPAPQHLPEPCALSLQLPLIGGEGGAPCRVQGAHQRLDARDGRGQGGQGGAAGRALDAVAAALDGRGAHGWRDRAGLGGGAGGAAAAAARGALDPYGRLRRRYVRLDTRLAVLRVDARLRGGRARAAHQRRVGGAHHRDDAARAAGHGHGRGARDQQWHGVVQHAALHVHDRRRHGQRQPLDRGAADAAAALAAAAVCAGVLRRGRRGERPRAHGAHARAAAAALWRGAGADPRRKRRHQPQGGRARP
eukprot:6152358-Prymnesium_polylepis.1